MRLAYLANIRMPTEKAHGLQIMQMCEAFAENGADVTLYVARRVNTPEMDKIADVWAHYGVSHTFGIGRIWSLDLYRQIEPIAPRVAFGLQVITYLLALLLNLPRADVLYTRDFFTVLALLPFKGKRKLFYEVHQRSGSGVGKRLQGIAVRGADRVIAVTGRLADEMRKLGAKHVMVAHDGFRIARFADMPSRADARKMLDLADGFIVGYMGRLHTMSIGKGIDTLIDAVAMLPDLPITLLLVGGPDEAAESLRQRWIAHGLPAERYLYRTHVPPARVPAYLAAFDVCAMPFPFTEHFAYYASPLKLFEYMAAGGCVLASDLPSTAEVVTHDKNAILYPPGDVNAMAAALRRLHDSADLRMRIGGAAKAEAAHYSWTARARQILFGQEGA
jgi:glycosyltransferase involved in cell wall biosynthesis